MFILLFSFFLSQGYNRWRCSFIKPILKRNSIVFKCTVKTKQKLYVCSVLVNISITSIRNNHCRNSPKKGRNQCFWFWCSVLPEPLSWCVVSVGLQPAVCEDRGADVIETCYRSTAAHKNAINTDSKRLHLCLPIWRRALVHNLYSQLRKTSRSKQWEKNTCVPYLRRAD